MQGNRTIQKGGDESRGFQITQDRIKRLIRLEFWGFWDEELGEQFRKTCSAAFDSVRADEGWKVLADISRYPPQKPAVQQVHSDMMALSVKVGITKAANLVSNTLGKLQIRRLSEESGLPEFSFFSDETSALAWLMEK